MPETVSGEPNGPASSDGLTPFELELLTAVTDDPLPPAGLALELDADFQRVLDSVAALQDRGLLARQGFSTCRPTERGREAVASDAA
jgi:hypothetical protein